MRASGSSAITSYAGGVIVSKGLLRAGTWPVTLRADVPAGEVALRPLRRRDAREWAMLREANAAWLSPWEATSPPGHGSAPQSFAEYVRILTRQAHEGTALPFAVELDSTLVGQLMVRGLTYGSFCSATAGYWVSKSVAGRGIIPTAVAMATDYCFQGLGLHRMEIDIRPENRPSLRVVEKLGFRDEGLRVCYLHINGVWADHQTFVLTAEEVPCGLLPRARALASRL